MQRITREEHAHILSAHLSHALNCYKIDCYGNHLSELEGYSVRGREAINLYLVKKFGWTLHECRVLSYRDVLVLLGPELIKFSPSQDADFQYLPPSGEELMNF
ncbi:hypothetical protein [Vibrio sp. HN007]|uniref:hypothetical protein n=1 Tax=Vibrio iocasae TaxID=3098914 RepID=UPI0035D48F97